jgi:hypothetical protein
LDITSSENSGIIEVVFGELQFFDQTSWYRDPIIGLSFPDFGLSFPDYDLELASPRQGNPDVCHDL